MDRLRRTPGQVYVDAARAHQNRIILGLIDREAELRLAPDQHAAAASSMQYAPAELNALYYNRRRTHTCPAPARPPSGKARASIAARAVSYFKE